MIEEIPFNKDRPKTHCYSINTVTKNSTVIKPVRLFFKPQEDITTFELAKCLPYLLIDTPVMPFEIDRTKYFMRHFEIIDPNEK